MGAVAAAIRSLRGWAVTPLLESVPDTPGTGDWSYIVAGTAGRVRCDADETDPWSVIRRATERLELSVHGAVEDDLPPFTGGLLGGLSYDLARHVERLGGAAISDRSVPLVDLVEADVVIAVDHRDETALLLHRPIGHERPSGELDEVVRAVAQAGASSPATAGARHRASTTFDRQAYLRAVEEVLGHIAAGDAFQVNLSQRLSARWPGDGASLYRALRAASPAPYGATVPCGDAVAASISPETFLLVRDSVATVRPIKGTRPRSADPSTDARLRAELETSAKDRAENVMVVDMERNDLGRVCEPGTVRVPSLCEVEAHPTVWHLVSTVVGRLRPSTDYVDLLRATFPCGSVTGTPKVRAMQLIDRYEPVRRGWYCGAIGFLGDGRASLSVAIRTAVLHPDGDVDYGAGGGIVADSDPAAEHDESLAKAAAFLTAVNAYPPASN